MASVLLDTTVLIDALRGRTAASRIRDLRRVGDTLYTSPINVEEIVRGLRGAEERKARGLLSGLRMAPLGRAEGERAGRWRRSFAARGVTLTQADCLIAAAAVAVRASLATANDKHFPMSELVVERWPAGA